MSEWQQIESAPEGEAVLLYLPAEPCAVVAFYGQGNTIEPGMEKFRWRVQWTHHAVTSSPSHWMPLPEPPK
jgi:hypothetical protein